MQLLSAQSVLFLEVGEQKVLATSKNHRTRYIVLQKLTDVGTLFRDYVSDLSVVVADLVIS